jgi:hypothetical protein
MDRREALKKMMAGGAVVAGASMVSSSHVFAAQSAGAGQPIGPGLTTPPPNSQIVNDKRTATWQITAPNVECSSGGRMEIASFAVPVTLSGNVRVGINSPTGWGDPYILDGGTASFTAVGTGPGNSPFRQGDSFEVIWSVRYSCTLNGQPAGCQIVTYRYRYANQRNGNPDWHQVPGSPMVVSSQSCSL